MVKKCPKLPISRITVTNFLQILQVLKKWTNTMSTNYKTHGHTLQKKFFFDWHHYPWKQRGARHQVGEKRKCLARQKFLADYLARDPKIWPNETFWPNWPPSVAVFNLNKKQKVMELSSLVFKILKKTGCPPLEWNNPLETPLPGMYSRNLKMSLRGHKNMQ